MSCHQILIFGEGKRKRRRGREKEREKKKKKETFGAECTVPVCYVKYASFLWSWVIIILGSYTVFICFKAVSKFCCLRVLLYSIGSWVLRWQVLCTRCRLFQVIAFSKSRTVEELTVYYEEKLNEKSVLLEEVGNLIDSLNYWLCLFPTVMKCSLEEGKLAPFIQILICL